MSDTAEKQTDADKIYKLIVNTIPDMIIRFGRDGVFHGFEGETAELGRPAEEYLHRSLQELLPPKTANLFLTKIEEAFESGEPRNLEYMLTVDGIRQHYEARMIRCNREEVLAIVRNVTRRLETEKALALYQQKLESMLKERTLALSRAETSYHNIFDMSGAATIMVDNDFTISKANAKFEEVSGYKKGEIEGRMRWIDFIAEPDKELIECYHYIRRTAEGRVPTEYECQMVDRRGMVRDIYNKVSMLPEPGRSLLSIIDITSLKKAEESLREREALYSAILRGYEGFIYIISNDLRIRFMNDNLIRTVGGDKTGHLCYQVLHQRVSPCEWCVREQIFKGDTVRFEMKNPHDKKWYYSVNIPIRNSDGTILCQSMIMDIDKHKRMEQALRHSESSLRKENVRLRSTIEKRNRFGDLVGKSAPMQKVYESMLMAAASDANVILYGESGTGKELVASAIHNMSDRRGNRFATVNCGAIPENLMESEFFGHVKGAFTGADRDKTGFLDEAHNGTLFLDEIGEIKIDFQVKLLRAIEGGGYTPIGSNTTQKPDFRIIAATSRDLFERVKQGAMRSDFFYRIHILPIHLPPLRERKDDIPLLVDHFLRFIDRQDLPLITDAVMDKLTAYHWPGNVRELQNVIYRFAALKRLELSTGNQQNRKEPVDTMPSISLRSLTDTINDFEKKVIEKALEQHQGNRTRTAGSLHIGLRTLQRKMKKFGIQ